MSEWQPDTLVKIIENSQFSNPLVEGNALLGHTRRDSDAAFEMLMRQWREGAAQSDPWSHFVFQKNYLYLSSTFQKQCIYICHWSKKLLFCFMWTAGKNRVCR